MESAVRVRTAVLPGGRIEFNAPELRPGDEVEVIVLSRSAEGERRALADILADAPGGRLFRTAQEVDAYIDEERDSWQR